MNEPILLQNLSPIKVKIETTFDIDQDLWQQKIEEGYTRDQLLKELIKGIEIHPSFLQRDHGELSITAIICEGDIHGK